MKKLTALFLTLVLLLSLSAPAFAARDTTFETALAGELKQLGVFQGVSDTDFALNRAPTRLEALVMLIRALGKEAEAKSGNWTHPFTDVPAWGDPYVGYAYSNKLTNGISDTEFGMSDAGAAIYLTFMLRALGYSDAAGKDFVWNNPYTLAKQVGILPDRVNTSDFWRADVVSVSYAALNAKLKDSSQTLAQKLIAANVFSADSFESLYRADAFTSSGNSSRAERTALTSEQIYERCMPAVFLIDVYDEYGDWNGSGSGFFIDDQGTGVTDHHVFKGSSYAIVTLSDAKGQELDSYEVLGVYDWSDEDEEDWAVFKVDISGNPYLRIGDKSTAVGGATVYALGSPLGLSASISDGVVSNPTRVFDGQTYIQTNAAIDHGSSGGALVNRYGEVVGITCGGFNGQNLNLAVPIDAIANAAHGTLTPIDETYVIAAGSVYPEYYYVSLHPGETVTNVITAIKENTDELLYVHCVIDDESIATYSWDSWTAEDTTVNLHLTAGDTFGETYATVYLYTADSETLLDYCGIYIEVVGGTVEPETYYVEMFQSESATVTVNAASFDGRRCKVRWAIDDETVVSASWGKWDGDNIPITINALACGEATVTLYLLDSETEAVLAQNSIYVEVYGGTLDLSDYELMLAPGETATVTITGEALDPSIKTVITADDWPSDIIDWQRGELGSGTVQLKITALEEGMDYIIITLLDENGNELNYNFIDVYVNMDGRGDD